MDEEETKQPTDNTGEGDKSKADEKIEQQNAAAERMEEANKKREELIGREEELAAQRAVEGTAEAGSVPIKKAPETDEEFTDRFLKGEAHPLTD